MSFYTYAHIREDDGKFFYIGKGRGRRAWAEAGRSEWWTRVRRKHGIRVQVLARWTSELEAFEHEKALIATFRELGQPLVNVTDGGEGFTGGRHSEEWKAAMSAFMKQRPAKPMSPESRAKLSATVKANPPRHWFGKKHRPESIVKRTAARIANTQRHEEGGLSMTLTQWAAYLGMHRSSLDYRLKVGKPLLAPKHSR